MNYFQMTNQIKKNFSWKECLHPDAGEDTCSKGVIRAHTVRRSADLKPLAEDGHVYQMSFESNVVKNNAGDGKPVPVGINKASTFYGFCSIHDEQTFSPLEKEDFISSPQQCFLLGYRAIIKEIYAKKSALKSIATFRNAAKFAPSNWRPIAEQMIDAFEVGSKSSMSDLETHHKLYIDCMRNHEYSNIRSVIFFFESKPNLVCSGINKPLYDFRGNILQDLSRIDLCHDMITLTIFTVASEATAAFVWHNSSDETCLPFMKSLLDLPHDAIPHAIIRFSFDSFENLFLRPSWWENLSVSEKSTLLDRFKNGTPLQEKSPQSLLGDDLRVVDWKIRDVIYVNYSA